MSELKITKPTFKKAEAEWFNYHKTKKEIKLLEESILHPHKEEIDENIGGGRSGYISNPTETTTIRLTRHKQLNYLNEIVSAIDTVYNNLSDDHKSLVQSRYWSRNRKTWDIIADECNVSRRQAIRWRDEIINETIEVLGWR